MEKLVIVGISSTAEHVFEFVNYYNLYEVVCFVVDKEYKMQDTYLGLPVYNFEELAAKYTSSDVLLFVAMLWNRLNADRRHVYDKVKQKGYRLANLVSPTAKIRSKLRGDNCWIHDYVVIQNNTELGSDLMVMAYTLIGANATIHNHCFFGAKSTVGGNCFVGEQTFVGINSTIFDDRHVGKKCIVGACTVVKRDLLDYSIIKTSSDNMVVVQSTEMNIENKLLFKSNVRK